MATPKKILIQDLELSNKEIARLRKENKKLTKNWILTQKERDKNGMDLMALQIENKRLRKKNKELKEKLEEADKYVVLQKIKNGEF